MTLPELLQLISEINGYDPDVRESLLTIDSVVGDLLGDETLISPLSKRLGRIVRVNTLVVALAPTPWPDENVLAVPVANR